MALRRSHGYEEMDGASHSGTFNTATTAYPITAVSSGDNFAVQEMELTTVSVVPDDTFTVPQAVNALGFGWFQVKLSLATGLCWMADSMEMSILSMLAPALHCHWGISKYQQALVTTVVFMGMMLSSTFWGHLSDRYGRKPALTLCSVLLLLYGLLSALAPSFLWLLLLRGLVGFAIGCVPQSVTLYAEFLPTQQRAKCVVLLDCFWALGACLEVVLALAVMPTLGWRWLLGLSTIPLLAFAIVTPWLPESARFHVASGQTEKALATLYQVAKDNGRPMLLGRLVLDGPGGNAIKNDLTRGRFMGLLAPHLRRTSLLLWAIWMSCAFCYYGLVLMTTELFSPVNIININNLTNGTHETAFINDHGNASTIITDTCQPLTTPDYMDLLWTTLAEFPGIFITIYIIERCGRKKTMAAQFVAYAICICLLLSRAADRLFLTIVLFIARGVIAGLFQAAYVYTPEVYPTALRSLGVGACSAVARLGAMLTPYVAQVLLQSSPSTAIGVYCAVALLACLACLLLPYETKGLDLGESSEANLQTTILGNRS